MAGRLRDLYARNLKMPEGLMGSFVSKYAFDRRNVYLEQSAAQLCKIQPHHKVLEVGFGPGHGIKSAYKHVKDGTGVIYGVELSKLMLKKASRNLKSEIKKKKVDLIFGSVDQLPFNTDTFHSVFHCNCYYFWSDRKSAIQELYRVMKPGSVMVATLNLSRMQHLMDQGLMKYGNIDPELYMAQLEGGGFDVVGMKHLSEGGKNFEAIIARIHEKEAHDEEYENILKDS